MKHVQMAAIALSLPALDGLAAEDLVAFVAEDELPLRGVAGWADWRLCGELTRQVKAGLFSGKAGETLLTVSNGRLPARRIFLFGVGPKASASHAALAPALAAVARAGGRSVAVEVPGGAPLDARSRVLQDAAREAGLREVVLLHEEEAATGRRAMAAISGTVPGLPLGGSR